MLTPTEGAAAPTISLLSSSKDTYGAKGLVHHHPHPGPHHHHPPPPPHDDQVTPMVGRRGAVGAVKAVQLEPVSLKLLFQTAGRSTRANES